MTNTNEVRTIEWTGPGYEGAYTQYVIGGIHTNMGVEYGTLYTTQIATRDNLARTLGSVQQNVHTGPLAYLRRKVDALIRNRVEDASCKELTD